MYQLVGTQGDRYLKPGTRVRRSIEVSENGLVTPQSGIVIHSWRDEDANCFLRYVAFFRRRAASWQAIRRALHRATQGHIARGDP